MISNPEIGLVTLPKVIAGQLIKKFDEFSLYNQVVGFETRSTSNLNSMTTWIEPRELAPEPLCGPVLRHEHFLLGLRNATAVYVDALVPHRTSKEVVSEYSSNSSAIPDYNSNSYYEFDFGSNPIEPESELNTTDEPLSGPMAGLVITSTPAGRFVY
jgi:hypothetical protein